MTAFFHFLTEPQERQAYVAKVLRSAACSNSPTAIVGAR